MMNIEINKWSIVLGFGGLFIIGISTAQWFFRYPDWSQFITGVMIGGILCGFAYIYDWMKMKDKKTEQLDKKLDSLIYPKLKEE